MSQLTPEWRSVVSKLVVEHLPYLSAGEVLDPQAELARFGLDSLSSVRLLVALEEALDIEIPTVDLVPATFRSLDSLAAVIGKLVNQG